MISERVAHIRARITAAAARSGRAPEAVKIVAAAKGQSREKIEEAINAGIRIIGHNYVQEAVREEPSIHMPDFEVHFIGHLQRNKAGRAVELFHVIQTLDDEKLAADLDRRAAAIGREIGVMIQVSLAGESQKSGMIPDGVESLLEGVRKLKALRLLGLMTMPPFFDEPERARPFFARLRELREHLISKGVLETRMNELSMGMTGDFEVAVEEGATMVRIGTALFGPRA